METLKARTEQELCTSLPKLPAEEAAVLALLQQRMERQLSLSDRARSKRGRRRITRRCRFHAQSG
jgi:hypothetical protein